VIAFGLYLIKVSIALIVLYLFYFVVLKNSTYFVLNRIYLLSGLFLSFIIPFLRFSIFSGQSVTIFETINIDLIEPDLGFFQLQNLTDEINTINYKAILSVIYFTGISILFFRLLFSIIRINRIKKDSVIQQADKIKIFRMNGDLPFSFINTVFLPKNGCHSTIINHEIAHIKQFHWIDLVFTEIALLLLWFNPFIFLYKQAIKLQHEYLADNEVIENNLRIEDYLNCMLKQVQKIRSISFVSQFYCKTIKKRIIMITKNKTPKRYLWLYFLILPLICILLFAFSGRRSLPVVYDNVLTNSSIDGYTPSIYPLDSKKIKLTMGYGERINPITKKNDFHRGIDFSIAEGVDIFSPADGIVIESSFETKLGNYLLIQHGEEFSTFYAHFKSAAVKVGDKLNKGQVIGITGNTGTYSTGPHLHYEVIKNGERVNPMDYLPQ
jgi:hypothetical protein